MVHLSADGVGCFRELQGRGLGKRCLGCIHPAPPRTNWKMEGGRRKTVSCWSLTREPVAPPDRPWGGKGGKTTNDHPTSGHLSPIRLRFFHSLQLLLGTLPFAVEWWAVLWVIYALVVAVLETSFFFMSRLRFFYFSVWLPCVASPAIYCIPGPV